MTHCVASTESFNFTLALTKTLELS
jgi:hypothetical protein